MIFLTIKHDRMCFQNHSTSIERESQSCLISWEVRLSVEKQNQTHNSYLIDEQCQTLCYQKTLQVWMWSIPNCSVYHHRSQSLYNLSKNTLILRLKEWDNLQDEWELLHTCVPILQSCNQSTHISTIIN